MNNDFMENEVWKRDEIDSPCIKVCVIHPDSGLCIGCYRNREEVTMWSRFTPEVRTELMKELPNRSGLVKGKRRTRR